jgi:hypothetical protein
VSERIKIVLHTPEDRAVWECATRARLNFEYPLAPTGAYWLAIIGAALGPVAGYTLHECGYREYDFTRWRP